MFGSVDEFAYIENNGIWGGYTELVALANSRLLHITLVSGGDTEACEIGFFSYGHYDPLVNNKTTNRTYHHWKQLELKTLKEDE